MNKRDLFDKNIKNAVEDYEASFDKAAWDKIDQKLSAGSAKGINSIKGWVAGAIIVAATAGGYWYFSESPKGEDVDSNIKDKIEQIDIKKSEDDALEKSVNEKDVQLNESVNENANQSEEDFNSKESKMTLDDSKDSESDDPVQEDDIKREDLNLVEPDQPNYESIEDDENLMVNWIISKNALCQGEELLVSIDNVNEPVELVWDFGDGKTSKDPKVSHKYTEPGTYIIKLKANSLISDKKVYREKKYIEVKANPQSSFAIVKNENMSAFPEVEFKNLTTYYNHIEWDFPDEKIENINSVEKFYRYKGRYQIGLIVTNHFGCKDSVYKDLVIENDYNLLAPNSFTPNNDGLNDTFLPEALTFLNKNFSMQIINTKSGRLVFETKNIESPWNGKDYNSGELLKGGLYIWTVKFDDGSIYSDTVKLIAD